VPNVPVEYWGEKSTESLRLSGPYLYRRLLLNKLAHGPTSTSYTNQNLLNAIRLPRYELVGGAPSDDVVGAAKSSLEQSTALTFDNGDSWNYVCYF
jgi:hypothetical protein